MRTLGSSTRPNGELYAWQFSNEMLNEYQRTTRYYISKGRFSCVLGGALNPTVGKLPHSPTPSQRNAHLAQRSPVHPVLAPAAVD